MSELEALIHEILELELEMFVNVRARYPVSCQQDPESFRIHRGSQFSVWSEATLQSYRDDLVRATADGRNLMTLKYARMEGQIPPLNDSPVIDEIATMELEFRERTQTQYPCFIARGRPLANDDSGATSFVDYLKGELETYSDQTLQLLLADLKACHARGENWTEAIYQTLVKKLGYESLEQVEAALVKKHGS